MSTHKHTRIQYATKLWKILVPRNFSLILTLKIANAGQSATARNQNREKTESSLFFQCRHIRRKMAQATYATRFFHSLTAMMTTKTILSNWNWNWMNRRSAWTVSHRTYSEKWTKKEKDNKMKERTKMQIIVVHNNNVSSMCVWRDNGEVTATIKVPYRKWTQRKYVCISNMHQICTRFL